MTWALDLGPSPLLAPRSHLSPWSTMSEGVGSRGLLPKYLALEVPKGCLAQRELQVGAGVSLESLPSVVPMCLDSLPAGGGRAKQDRDPGQERPGRHPGG